MTERRTLNEALKESEEKFRTLVEGAPIGVFIIQDGKLVYANPRISDISGYSTDELYNASPLEVIAPEDRDLVRANIEKLATGTVRSICQNYRYIRKDGTLADIESYGAGTHFNGRPAIIGTVQDITGRKILEREKEDFYAMITHDLRSPLTSIIGYTHVIMELYKDRIDEDLLLMIKKIDQSSLMLSSMMEDFMTFSAIEHSRLEIIKTKEYMPELIESVYGEYMLTASNKGINLTRDIGSGVATARVDRNLIRRACCNLLQNALKYTRAGGTVAMKAERRLVDGIDSIAVSFSDTGPGIPESERDRIFQKYYRSGSSKGTKGSGLGLAIVKSIAVGHGGRVELESTEGIGSVFTLIIPA
jgi:PAS domain S-box-containing protein